jgi:hypothetical protein
MKTLILLALSGTVALSPVEVPRGQIEVSRNQAEARFPDAITFYLAASSPDSIESVELEFGTDAAACGESIARIVPEDFLPGTAIATEWTWDLRRTGPLPPGTTVWWRWILRDGSGAEVTTPDLSLVVEDNQHAWRETAADPLQLHWYTGNTGFAETLLDAGETALGTIRQAMGVEYEGDIRLYIYNDSIEMQSATLFAPDWSGGLAFPEHSAVLIAIAPDELEWGRRVVAHELTHVVVGQYTFSCLDSTPPWVSEGLAMYAEGEPEKELVATLDEAVQQGTLLPVRSLSQSFSNDPYLAYLAYAQSYSLVAYLVEEYGPEEMVGLLDQFRQGTTEDQALQRVYQFDREGLEAAWRRSIGAAEAEATGASDEKPTRTPYPTFAPLGGANTAAGTSVPGSLAVTATPMSTTGKPEDPEGAAPGMCATPGALGAAGLGLVLIPHARRRVGGWRRRGQ